MIVIQAIGLYQSQILNLNELSETAFYSWLQNRYNAMVNHINTCNKVESGCNFYTGGVAYSCTELTAFKTSIKERGYWKWH